MSLKHALEFINLVHTDPALRAHVAQLTDEETLDPLIELAAERNLLFTEDELRQAFKHDWTMRWIRYRSSTP